MTLNFSSKLDATCRAATATKVWLEQLPETINDIARQWRLSLGPAFDNDEVSCAWVAPVTRADGSRAVLKLAMPHFEGEHEIEGLRYWDGNPTVKLFDSDDALGAMLLEHCEPGTHLRALSESEQDRTIAKLLRQLWRAPSVHHPFRPLSALLTYWAEEILAQKDRWRDPGLVQEGLRLFRELSGDSSNGTVLATDLHAGNVLRAKREPWLVIDPKPFVGDRAYDATQHLLNCRARLFADSDRTIRQFADLLDVEHDRVRRWTFARLAVELGDDSSDPDVAELARRLC